MTDVNNPSAAEDLDELSDPNRDDRADLATAQFNDGAAEDDVDEPDDRWDDDVDDRSGDDDASDDEADDDEADDR